MSSEQGPLRVPAALWPHQAVQAEAAPLREVPCSAGATMLPQPQGAEELAKQFDRLDGQRVASRDVGSGTWCGCNLA